MSNCIATWVFSLYWNRPAIGDLSTASARVGILGMVFSLIQKKKKKKPHEIHFTFPRSVEWIMFLPSPVCAARIIVLRITFTKSTARNIGGHKCRKWGQAETLVFFVSFSGWAWTGGTWCSAPASGERAAALANDVALFCFRAER